MVVERLERRFIRSFIQSILTISEGTLGLDWSF